MDVVDKFVRKLVVEWHATGLDIRTVSWPMVVIVDVVALIILTCAFFAYRWNYIRQLHDREAQRQGADEQENVRLNHQDWAHLLLTSINYGLLFTVLAVCCTIIFIQAVMYIRLPDFM